MSSLTIYADTAPHAVLETTSDGAEIAARLRPLGVRFERWPASAELAADADDEAVLAAYRAPIDRLVSESGYRSVDVLRILPDTPDHRALRTKFLDEHRHEDDEIRFFVEGAGCFYLRGNGAVHAVLCTRGDLISVPAQTRHWFDMGPTPRFTAVRLYARPEGWIANFTGDTIAAALPAYEGTA